MGLRSAVTILPDPCPGERKSCPNPFSCPLRRSPLPPSPPTRLCRSRAARWTVHGLPVMQFITVIRRFPPDRGRQLLCRLRKEGLRRLRARRVSLTFRWEDAAHLTRADSIVFPRRWTGDESRPMIANSWAGLAVAGEGRPDVHGRRRCVFRNRRRAPAARGVRDGRRSCQGSRTAERRAQLREEERRLDGHAGGRFRRAGVRALERRDDLRAGRRRRSGQRESLCSASPAIPSTRQVWRTAGARP